MYRMENPLGEDFAYRAAHKLSVAVKRFREYRRSIFFFLFKAFAIPRGFAILAQN